MTYSSRLELVIDSRSGERSLKRVERGLVDVDRAGDRAAGSLSGVTAEASRLRGVALAASGALVGLAGAAGAGEVIRYADAWSNTTNQIRQVTNSSDELAKTQRELLQIANDSRSTYESTVDLYTRLEKSTQELGISSERLLGITDSINKSFALSGATADESAGAITQLAQGLAAGALRGDEFNSVAEQAPEIMRAISDSLDMTTGELKDFAAEGGITAQVIIDAMEGAAASIDQAFGESIATFGQKMAVSRNNILEWVGASEGLNEAVGLAGDAILGLSRNIDTLVDGAQFLAVLMAGRLSGSLATATAAKLAATRQSATYQAAIARLTSVSGTAATAQLAMGAAVRTASGAMALLGGPAGVAVLAAGSIYYFREELGLVQRQTGLSTDELEKLRGEVDDLSEAALNNRISALSQDLKEVTLDAAAARDELSSLSQVASGAGVLGFDAGHIGQNVRATTALGDALERQKKIEQELLETRQELGSRNFKTLDEWLFENPGGGSGGGGGGDASKDRIRELERQADALEALRREFDPMRAAQADYNERLGMLNEALARGVVGQEEYGRGIRWAADQLQQAAVDADPYLSRLKAINEEYVKGQSLGELFAQQQAANSITGPAGEIARSGIGGRIEDQVMQGAPVVEGLEPEYGGAFGELQRIQQEREALQAWYDEKIAMYQQYRELEAENAAQYNSVIAELEQQRASQMVEIQKQESQARLMGASELFGSLSGIAQAFAGEQSDIYRGLFAAEKAYSVASVLLSSYDAIAKAWASAPFPYNLPSVAVATAETGALSAAVQGVGYAGAFDNGGNIPAGKWGIAGEYGPEIVEGPARVTSRKQTAEMLQGGDGGGVEVDVQIINQGQPKQVNARLEQAANKKFILSVMQEDLDSGSSSSYTGQLASRYRMKRGGT